VSARSSGWSKDGPVVIIHPMSRELVVKILLWYNVLSLGIWVGGTLYQMAVVVPMWSASPPESVRAFFQGTSFMTTIRTFFGPVTQVARALPTFVLAAVAWKYEARPWIVACAATLVVGLVMTRAYIYPMNDVLFEKAGGDLSPDAVRALVRTWILADRMRFAIMTGGYLCLLRAFSLPLAARE
jgi:hypothetical protein